MPRTTMELDYWKGEINMKAYHICYHTDEDGLASAAVIYEYLKRISRIFNEKVTYFFYKIDYTMDLRKVLTGIPCGDELYFVDYSFSNKDNLKYVLELTNGGTEVYWIDHHKTSEDIVCSKEFLDLKLDSCMNFHWFINTDFCGAYLCYAFAYARLNGTTPDPYRMADHTPLYIKYVDSWDTWKHNMPNTIEFNIGIRSEKRTPKNTISSMLNYNSDIINKLFSYVAVETEIVNSYMKKYIDNVIENGKVIKQYQDIENESLCNDYGFEFKIIDASNYGVEYRCFALNKRGNSTMFGNKINDYDIVVPFQFNGVQYVYSLYTAKDNVNCEVLAKKLGSINGLGGGGHTKAAGFQTYNQIFKANNTVYINNKLFRKGEYRIVATTK